MCGEEMKNEEDLNHANVYLGTWKKEKSQRLLGLVALQVDTLLFNIYSLLVN